MHTNADPPKRTGVSCAQGSFKVIGPPTSGARAYLNVRDGLLIPLRDGGRNRTAAGV